MNDAKTCPKCQHPMNSGFITDRSPEDTLIRLWVEGEPQRTWKGLKIPAEKSFPVTTYRCVSCGFIEAYAVR